MSKPEQAQEPTMEEILASIRRIISDDAAEQEDEAAPEEAAEPEMQAAAEPEPVSEPEPEADDDVLELTEELSTQEAEALIAAETADEEADVVFQDKEMPEAAPVAAAPPRPEPAAEQPTLGAAALASAMAANANPGLLSPKTDASVASAFSSLENFVLSTHSRTLEDLVSEMLRPMLKSWLDANLPQLVERLVREEIERVTRGRR